MHFSDLKRSNAVYIFRSIMHSPKSLKEISKETEIAEITIKKISYNLVDAEIISKCSIYDGSVGRPTLHLSPNPINYSVLITKTSKEYVFYSVNTLGKRKKLFKISKSYQLLDESETLKFAYKILINNDIHKYCHGVFLIGEEIDNLNYIEGIVKTTPFQLISQSLIDDNLAIYLQFGDEKAFINHGKIKNINISKEELVKIVDIDQDYTFKDLDIIKATNEALRILTLKQLEEKVAQSF